MLSSRKKFPSLEVDVLFNDENVGKWVLGPTRETQERKVKVEPKVLKRRHPLSIAFHIPGTPHHRGSSTGRATPGYSAFG